jgi:hypothetical protein
VDRWPRKSSEMRSRSGSALVLVLWITVLLTMLVGTLAFDALVESRLVTYQRNRWQADELARSGIEVAKLVLEHSREVKPKDQLEGNEEDRFFAPARALSRGLAAELTEELPEGLGTLRVLIIPEPARINVNTLAPESPANDERWERILAVGDIPEEYWGELVDSFYDWVDPDGDARVDGAESDDYYAEQDPPYRARNEAALDTVGELLLVKGFDRTILYGGALAFDDDDPEEAVQISGIADMLTVYGEKINVNAAGQRVLMTLPGVDELVVDAILTERETPPDDEVDGTDNYFESAGDFATRIGALGFDVPAELRNAVSTESAVYRVTLEATVRGVSRSVWCIVERYGKDAYRILRWREDG